MTLHVPPVAIVQQAEVRQVTAKIELLKAHPYCAGCGNAVVAMAGRPNSASLVIDRLACPNCVKRVREARIAERSGDEPRRPSSSNRRARLKHELQAVQHHCTSCGDELSDVVCMAAGHLFCGDCVGQVRQRPRKVQLQIIEAMKRQRAEQPNTEEVTA
jgi:hypothetical protein